MDRDKKGTLKNKNSDLLGRRDYGWFQPFQLLLCLCNFYFFKWGEKSLWDFFSVASPLLGMAAFMEQKLPTKKDVLQWG